MITSEPDRTLARDPLTLVVTSEPERTLARDPLALVVTSEPERTLARDPLAPVVTSDTEHARARDPLALLKLCHLVSPALPVGAYAYSQGLEYAVHAGWVGDESGVHEWLAGLSRRAVGTLDLPILRRLHCAWERQDAATVARWNSHLIASRETAEFRAEERHLGAALARVLITLEIDEARGWALRDPAFATMFALAAVRWHIALEDALHGYLWAWTENQVLAAIKLVPLGQSAGQRLLHRLTLAMPGIVERALAIEDEAIGVGSVSQMLASAFHELQYSRLFRS